MTDIIEIYDNPLTPDRLEAHAAKALAEGGVERARQAIHAGLRNMIWSRNAFGLNALFARKDRWTKYGGLNTNASFSRGSVLHYAVSAPLLAQGKQAIECFEILLRHGANPAQAHPYCLHPEDYRSGKADFHGSVVDYLQHLKAVVIEGQVKGMPDIRLGNSTETILETIDYAMSVAAPFLPGGYRPAAVPAELAATGRRSEAIVNAFYEASQAAGCFAAPEIVRTPARVFGLPAPAND